MKAMIAVSLTEAEVAEGRELVVLDTQGKKIVLNAQNGQCHVEIPEGGQIVIEV